MSQAVKITSTTRSDSGSQDWRGSFHQHFHSIRPFVTLVKLGKLSLWLWFSNVVVVRLSWKLIVFSIDAWQWLAHFTTETLGAVVTAHSELPCHTHYIHLASHSETCPHLQQLSLHCIMITSQQEDSRDTQRISLWLAYDFTMLFSDWRVNIIIKNTVQ